MIILGVVLKLTLFQDLSHWSFFVLALLSFFKVALKAYNHEHDWRKNDKEREL